MGTDAVERWVVAIMAKAPLAGDVKTRLCPPLRVPEAAALYRAFLCDKIEQVRSLESAGHAIAFTPEHERGTFEELAPDFTLIPQRGADLGGRLAATFEQLFARGHAGVLLIDSDTPTLPTAFLFEALQLIAKPETDLVLGPSEDGGYYLIGLRARRPELFEGVPWSTPAVVPETIRRARVLGLAVARLPRWFDVDTDSDLARLRDSMATIAGASARHTRRFLDGRP